MGALTGAVLSVTNDTEFPYILLMDRSTASSLYKTISTVFTKGIDVPIGSIVYDIELNNKYRVTAEDEALRINKSQENF